MRISSQPVFEQEHLVGAQGILTDITEQKLAEAQVHQQNDFLTSVIESLTHPFYVLDIDNYTIQLANTAARVGGAVGATTCYALTHRRDQPCSSADHPCPIDIIRHTQQPVMVEHIHYDQAGSERTVEVYGYPVFDGEGAITQVIEYSLDITERQLAVDALREAKEAAEAARQKERARRQEAEQRRRVAESLAGVLTILNSGQSLDRVLHYIVMQAAQLLSTEAAVIFRSERDSGETPIQAAFGLPPDTAATVAQLPGMEALSRALTLQRPVAVTDLTQDQMANSTLSFQALLAIPIVVKEDLYGGIAFYYAGPRSFSDDQIELAAVFGDQVTLAVENARLRSQAEASAAVAERHRLARDLHDSVTQALFSASLVAEVLPKVWQRNPAEALGGVEELRLLTRGALAEMRTMLLELRPAAVVETKLDVLIRQLLEAVAGRTQLEVNNAIEPVPDLPPQVHVTFYRVAQEAMNNTIKHAEATTLAVSLQATPPKPPDRDREWRGRVTLKVSDDGRGMEPAGLRPDQLGLSIMRERAESVGAHLTIESGSDRGTRVTLTWRSP
jgi:signal transduction histidine kinase